MSTTKNRSSGKITSPLGKAAGYPTPPIANNMRLNCTTLLIGVID